MKFNLNHMNSRARHAICCLWMMCLAMMAGGAGAYADGVATLERDGRSYAVPLPKGYCDITATPLGVLLHKFMGDVTAANNLAPKIDIIFQNCAAEAVFPWGYVATNNLGGIINSQQVLNKMRADLFGQTELLEDLLEASTNTNLDTIAEWGIDVSEVTPGAHTIIWTDAHSIVTLVDSIVVVEGTTNTERLVSSGTVFDGLVFEFAIYDDKVENDIDVKATAIDLAQNARELKLMNGGDGVSHQTSGNTSHQKD